jgi:3-oxoacyl-[acyl-carrier-protein] synthase III
MKAQITAIGHYLPDKVIDNKYLQEKFHIDEASILKRTGIKERRYAENGITTTNIVCSAINNMLKNTTTKLDDIECIIVGTLTPDYFFPSTAVSAINKIGAPKAWGFDLSAACSGFCYGLNLAKAMVEQGSIKMLLYVVLKE